MEEVPSASTLPLSNWSMTTSTLCQYLHNKNNERAFMENKHTLVQDLKQ